MTRSYPLAITMLLAVLAAAGGCAKTPQGRLDQQKAIYGQTVGALNDAMVAGLITDRTWLEVVSPARRIGLQYLQQAQAAIDAGHVSLFEIHLQSLLGAIAELQRIRAGLPPPPATRPTIGIPLGMNDAYDKEAPWTR